MLTLLTPSSPGPTRGWWQRWSAAASVTGSAWPQPSSAPWGEVAADVRAYLSYEQPYGVGPLMTSVIAAARAHAQDEDRAAVAARVRELVSSSGLTRREFADALGTSVTRLSTYCTGSVTPSAALLLRMERASASRDARRSPTE